MADTHDVANCHLSAKRQFTPHPDLGDMTKILIFAVQTSYENEQAARLHVYQEIPLHDGIVRSCVLNPLPAALFTVLIDLLVQSQGEL